MGKIKEIKDKAEILSHALFHGMAAADDIMTKQVHGEDAIEINQQVRNGGVFQDMLEQKETQRVIEMRDKYYRVLREADKYKVELSGSIGEEDIDNPDAMMFGLVKKKTKEDFMKHPPVFEEEGFELRTIQDNKHIVKNNGILGIDDGIIENYFGNGLYDYQTTLTVERGDFIPRFELDKFVKRMVVKNKPNSDRAHVDLYLPTEASQFGKIDAILISRLNEIYQSKDFRADFIDFKTIEWYSDKAWNSEDVCLFKYDDCHPIDICVFDGSFVLTYDCHVVNDGKDLAKKYETKELTEKYEKKAPKNETTDISVILRRIDKENNEEASVDVDNLTNTTLKIS